MTRPAVRLLADCEWLHEPTPPELVQGLSLAAGSLAALVAASGTGKTFVALPIATSLATGSPFLGRAIGSPRPVVYAVGEGQAAFPRRLAAIRTQYGLREEEPSGVFFVREPLSLVHPDDITCLLDSMRGAFDGEKPALFVLDPLASFMAGADENSTKDMSTVVAALNRIREETGAAVLVCHHTGWNAERERGSTVLRAAVDLLYNLKQDDGILTLECVKLRDGVMPAPLYMRLRSVAESCVVELADAPTSTPRPGQPLTKSQQQARAVLKDIATDQGVAYSKWELAAEMKPRTFALAVKALVAAGEVHKGEGRNGRYTLVKAGKEAGDVVPF